MNLAPVLTVPGNQTFNELVAFSGNATATDADLPVQTANLRFGQRTDWTDGFTFRDD